MKRLINIILLFFIVSPALAQITDEFYDVNNYENERRLLRLERGIVDLELEVIGTLGLQNGGTGKDLRNQLEGSILYFDSNGEMAVLEGDTDGYVLVTHGTSAPPTYEDKDPKIGTSGCLLITASEANPSVWTTEDYDIANNCTTTTFTAPETGYYLISFHVSVDYQNGGGVQNCQATVNTTPRSYTILQDVNQTDASIENLSLTVVQNLSATNTVTVGLNANSSNCTYSNAVLSIYRLN